MPPYNTTELAFADIGTASSPVDFESEATSENAVSTLLLKDSRRPGLPPRGILVRSSVRVFPLFKRVFVHAFSFRSRSCSVHNQIILIHI